MKIGIIGAMDVEVANLKEAMKKEREVVRAGRDGSCRRAVRDRQSECRPLRTDPV